MKLPSPARSDGSSAIAFLLALCVAAVAVVVVFKFRASGTDDEFMTVMSVGKNYLDKGEAPKAIAAFEKAVALNPTYADAHLDLANAYLLAAQSDKAIQQAQATLDLDRNSAAAFYVLGCANLRLAQFQPALKALQQAHDIDTNVAAVAFQLGRTHEALGQFEDAIRAYQETLALEPEHPSANFRLSQALVRVGRQDEANQALERHRQLQAQKPNLSISTELLERCQYTQARAPFRLEQPEARGVKVTFSDATAAAFGDAAAYHGPVGVIDLSHDGQNSLFVAESDKGFRLLLNQNGTFQAHGEILPGVAGAHYVRCLVGDLNNDRVDEVIVLGDKASHVFKFATNGSSREVTAFAGLKGLTAVDGVLVDLDFTGKLDLLAVTAATNGVRLFRNLGNLYFVDRTATSGVPATVTGVRRLALDDWNNDDLNDLFVLRTNQPPLLFMKQRGGPFALTNSPPDWPAGTAIALGDLNNDLRADLVIAAAGKLECFLSGVDKPLNLPTGGETITSLKLFDYDNDGWLDICAGGERLRIWRNLGQAGFKEVTDDLGLDKLVKGRINSITTADLDGDGDTDLLVDVETQGLRLLRNDGGNANGQLKLRLVGNRSNASGLGMRLELAAGPWRTRHTVTSLPIEIGVGRHAHLDSLTVHWFDLAQPIVDLTVDSRTTLNIDEMVLPTGSCPYLYAWDGKQFRFVTDILGASPVGLRLSDDRFIDADTHELVWIGDEKAFPTRAGKYELQITSELREVLYLDEAKLVAVDHPAGTEAHSTDRMVPRKPFPPTGIMTLHRRKPLLRATRLDGADVTQLLEENDGRVVSPVKLRVPQLRGLAEPFGVILDFGPLETDQPLVLALTGWLRFGGGMANVAASHNPDLPFPFPILEVETSANAWQPVDVVVGTPIGKTKTIVVDLTGKLPAGSRRLRLRTAFEIHWDRIALFERADPAGTRLMRLEPASTDLHWRGFSEYRALPWQVPLTPDYNRVNPNPKWDLAVSGWCTRYGSVDELIARPDNAFALVNGGDELTLRFRADRLPPKPAGYVRDFFLYTDGWEKDADYHVELGWLVEPLPWHGMDDQLYGRQPRPAFGNDQWMQDYNTRWVGPWTLRRENAALAAAERPTPR
ncbi:MAG: FG-GAP-like repeat-containing protein [Limisphaerales bacterium]